MHVHGLDRDQRAEPLSALDDDLRHEPGIDEAVVGVDQRALAASRLAPPRGIHDALEVGVGLRAGRWRSGREDPDVGASGAHTYASLHGRSAGHSSTVRRSATVRVTPRRSTTNAARSAITA